MASPARLIASAFGICVLSASPLTAQEEPAGYAIQDQTVINRCSRCHEADDDGRMSRISYLRKTPEGWQTSIRRMVALHGARLDQVDARAIVRYLSDEQGLAPEELRPGNFEVERRLIEHDYEGDSEVEFTCIQCHSMGRVITQRRTEEEWALLLATHRGLYPLVDFQAFRSAPPGETQPMEKAIEHLSEVFPLETPEWSAWAATKRAPSLAGEWTLSGYEPGKGPVFGTVTITATGTPAEFVTSTTYTYPESGERVTRNGQALVYTGYQWRGRSNPGGDDELREVMFVERDQQSMSGRWFRGAYDEIGPDVTLRRAGPAPVLSGMYPRALRRGTSTTVTLYGASLPAAMAGTDALDLGPGVSIQGMEASGGTLRLTVAVDADARSGARDLFAFGTTLPEAVVVHDGIDRIEVTPRTGMARVGGEVFPKGYQTFEAIGWDDGPDGESNTEDDLRLGRVDVAWSTQEYAAVLGDDDIQYVGTMGQNGVFMPAADGPNPNRVGNRNNIGDIWVIATHRNADGEELSARAHLIVTVPLYMRFEPWREVDPRRTLGGGW